MNNNLLVDASSRDGLMTPADFAMLCRTLFRNPHGKAYPIEKQALEDMFNVFDVNQVHVKQIPVHESANEFINLLLSIGRLHQFSRVPFVLEALDQTGEYCSGQ